jgi:hypothetical protein
VAEVEPAAGGGGVDRLRMRIWNPADGSVVYDTQPGAPASAAAATAGGTATPSRKRDHSAPSSATGLPNALATSSSRYAASTGTGP